MRRIGDILILEWFSIRIFPPQSIFRIFFCVIKVVFFLIIIIWPGFSRVMVFRGLFLWIINGGGEEILGGGEEEADFGPLMRPQRRQCFSWTHSGAILRPPWKSRVGFPMQEISSLLRRCDHGKKYQIDIFLN